MTAVAIIKYSEKSAGCRSVFYSDMEIKPYNILSCFWTLKHELNNNNNNNTYIALIRMRSKRFTSIVLQYDLEI